MRGISNEEEVNKLGAFRFGECWEANMGLPLSQSIHKSSRWVPLTILRFCYYLCILIQRNDLNSIL